jgi:hypothetical protein
MEERGEYWKGNRMLRHLRSTNAEHTAENFDEWHVHLDTRRHIYFRRYANNLQKGNSEPWNDLFSWQQVLRVRGVVRLATGEKKLSQERVTGIPNSVTKKLAPIPKKHISPFMLSRRVIRQVICTRMQQGKKMMHYADYCRLLTTTLVPLL